MAVKFPLKMADGTAAGTMEELREHFDLEAVLGYYSNGRLVKWLEDRYYYEEADQIRGLKESSKKFNQKLCGILGVPYSEKTDKGLKIGDIVKGNERREFLKQHTTDDRILAAVDRVAFTQSELDNLLKRLDTLEADDEGNKVIYLCGKHFIIPADIEGIVYKGVNNPTVEFAGEVVASGIDLQDLKVDMSDYIKDSAWGEMHNVFENNLSLGLKLLRQAADQGDADAQFVFGLWCFEDHDIADLIEDEDPMEWWRKAADQGHIDANVYVYHFKLIWGLSEGVEAEKAVKWFKKEVELKRPYVIFAYAGLGKCYMRGIGVEQNVTEAVKYLKRAVKLDEDNGWETFAEVQYYLGYCYYYGLGVDRDYEEAFKWLQGAYEQDYIDAMVLLGMCYQFGRGVKKNSETAVELYRKGAEWHDRDAIYQLGCCYANGEGVEQSYKEAAKWFQKAVDAGYEDNDVKHLLDVCNNLINKDGNRDEKETEKKRLI